MKSLPSSFYWLFPLVLTFSCGKAPSDTANESQSAEEASITIQVSDKKQTIRNFGASDAWVCQFVGQWPDEKRNQVADWLFSTEMDDKGQPKGIGLSIWRFNIGAGSATQGNISDPWRRTEGFLNTDGKTYDWSRQAGQRWFLQAAKQRGVDQFLGFTNSPPVQMTKNGNAYSSQGDQANIAPAKYDAFVTFLAEVVKHLGQKEGITMHYLSPFNEPQWDWTGNNQEGTPYTNQQMYDITRKLDSVLTVEKLSTKIQIAEAGKINYLYELADKPTRGNQIEEFFSPGSSRYVGNMSHVDKVISAHSYFTTMPTQEMKAMRQTLHQKVRSVGNALEYWQSEYCILGDQEEIPGAGKDTGINPALYVARLVHFDLTEAQASAWHWWLSLTAYDYKDGLVYVDKNAADGKVEDTRLLWALGNFSRFIRPGAVRVGLESKGIKVDDPNGMMVSAYVHEADKKLVTVLINYGHQAIETKVKAAGVEVQNFQPYITSGQAGEQLKPLPVVKAGDRLSLPPRSILTLVGDMQ
jgi:O-glycosyl hydrolase